MPTEFDYLRDCNEIDENFAKMRLNKNLTFEETIKEFRKMTGVDDEKKSNSR